MSDRELLEKAAKAAGYTTTHKWNAERMLMNPPVLAMVVHKSGQLVTPGWEPLEDDGDAMRLAVELGIEFGYGWNHDETIQRVIIDDNLHVMVEDGDACAAVRRAIVRAAAALAGEAQG